MSFPKRSDSSVPQFRLRTPPHLVAKASGRRIVVSLPSVDRTEPRVVETTVGREVKFSLRTRDPAVAAIWQASARSEVERFFAAIEAGPRTLSHRDLVALSGAVYRLYIETHGDDPGDPDAWAAFKGFNRAAAEGRIVRAPALGVGEVGDDEAAFATFGDELTAGIDALPVTDSTAALEDRFGVLATWVLVREGIDVDAATRVLLLRQVAAAATDAGWAMKRAALGDYTPDAKAGRFPEFRPKANAVSVRDLFDRWRRETQPAASTVANWRTVTDRLEKELGRKSSDISRVSPEDIIAFKDALVAKGLSAKTVSDSYLAAVKALFNWAVANRLLMSNPAVAVKISVKAKAGARMLPYTDDEVGRLLQLAEGETLAYRRWIPLLCATTGARVGEIAQLWGSRVTTEDGIHVLRIAPAEDGGSLKNDDSERTVPIHPAVIEAGFLQFVASKGGGPLFYRRSKVKIDGEGRHASKGATNHLAAWIRENGFTDPRKAPNHAFRHWNKTALVKARVTDSVSNALQGHVTPGEASRYRHIDLSTLFDAVKRIELP